MNAQTVILHPINMAQINALKAFSEALNINFEITDKSPLLITKL